MTDIIRIDEKIRVNMGWQCPECSSAKVESRETQYKYQCRECGCNWDGHYYPLPTVQRG